jgi:phage major head subunit gpT-like protein
MGFATFAPVGSNIAEQQRLQAAYIGFSTLFNQALARFNPIFSRIATVVQTSQTQEDYNWIGTVPTMKRWQGDRPLKKLRGEKHTIENEDWANGIEISRNDLREDRLGIVSPKIAELAEQAMYKMDARVIDMYVNGFAGTEGTCYDGQFLFDSDHTAAGNGVGTSQQNFNNVALSEDNFDDAWAAMMAFTDEENEPHDLSPDVLLCGPSNRAVARKIVQQRTQATGEDNMNYGAVDLIVTPRITDDKWFLIKTRTAVRPVILQVQQQPMFAALDQMTDYQAFMRKTFLYGADASFGTGYGRWQCAYGANP